MRFRKTTVNVLFRWVGRDETISVDGWIPEGVGVNVAVIRNPSGGRGWQVVRASDGCLLCYADSQDKARTVASWVVEAAEAGQLDPGLDVRAGDTWRTLSAIKTRAIEEGLGY